ncbi:hypothetical protein FOZ63_014357 [Perkinsus olseni]|uniref:Impact N-terminal domain-containing protein n=1 Tax=Perkinsus olseni TaxID=32597 RepID=A0A7J6UL74_PEROL|nr:hypothetical protein FOZ63_014357 [Perkinsus olseni]
MWLHRPASPDDGDVAYAITIHGETDVEADATFMFTLPKGYPLELDVIPEVIAAEGSEAVCSKLKKLQELIVGNIWTQLKGGYEFPILAALAPVKGLLTKFGMAWEAEEEEKAKQEAEAREQKKASEREKAVEREKAEAEQAEMMQEEAEKEYNAWASQMAAMQGRKEEFRKGNSKNSLKGKGRGTKAPKTADPSDLKEGEPITEKKSKFQAHLAFVDSEEDVDIALNTLKQSHKILRATHNMYAYRFKMKEEGGGKDSKSADLGYHQDHDSDGEGGAGTKLQELLTLTGAEGVLVVVSRWYGGIHLGPLRFKLINRVARQILQDEGPRPCMGFRASYRAFTAWLRGQYQHRLPGPARSAVAMLGYMSMGFVLTREGIPMVTEAYRLMTRPEETPEFIDPLPTEATLERWEKDRQLRGLDMTVASPDDVAKIMYGRGTATVTADDAREFFERYGPVKWTEEALGECIRLSPLLAVADHHHPTSATAKWSRELLSRKCDLTCVSSLDDLKHDDGGPREDITLLMVYPRNDSEAFEVLKAFSGRRIIYVGEGPGGFCADPRFFEELFLHWRVVRTLDLGPQLGGQTAYSKLYVLQRRESPKAK